MSDSKDALVEDLTNLFAKHNIENAFLAIPQPAESNYILLPYQMGNNMIRHLAASLLQNIPHLDPPTLN